MPHNDCSWAVFAGEDAQVHGEQRQEALVVSMDPVDVVEGNGRLTWREWLESVHPSLLAVWTLHVLGLCVRERNGVYVELWAWIGWTDDGTLQSD